MTGLFIQWSRAGGIQAKSRGNGMLLVVESSLNCWNCPFDKASAIVDKVFEHRVIFVICTRHPRAAAIQAIAPTIVVDRGQEVLYPFFHINTEAALSTHILTGEFLHQGKPADSTNSGPMSSSADMARLSFFPVGVGFPRFMALDHGI